MPQDQKMEQLDFGRQPLRKQVKNDTQCDVVCVCERERLTNGMLCLFFYPTDAQPSS